MPINGPSLNKNKFDISSVNKSINTLKGPSCFFIILTKVDFLVNYKTTGSQ